MIFEKIGALKVDKDLRAFAIQIDAKTFLVSIQDLELALRDNRTIGVFRIKETPVQQETAASEQTVTQESQEHGTT